MHELHNELACSGSERGLSSIQSRFLAHGLSGSMPSAERSASTPQCAPLTQKAWMHGPAHLSARGCPLPLASDPFASHSSRIADGEELLPGGRLELHAERATAEISGFMGLLAGRTRKTASLEELTEAAAAGWAAQ
jgi:hypothetical protein